MATVRESCLCGATFEFSDSNSAAVTIAVSQFRREHSACRIVAAAEYRPPASASPFPKPRMEQLR